MSNANKNAKAFREKFDKTGGDVDGPVTVNGAINSTGDRVAMSSDANNLHYWMLDSKNVERALIWHEGSSDQLKFRVKSSNKTISLTNEGVVYANRFAPTDTLIGVHCTNLVSGGEGGLIRGQVAGGTWSNWRDRAAGVHIDAQNSDSSAHTLIKATHWGVSHLVAMDVHRPVSGGTIVKMHLGNGQDQFSFYENGQGYAVGGWHTGSDERFKENITPVGIVRSTGFLDKVKNLQAKQFNYRGSDKTIIGFIAQDVEKILPQAVTTLVDTTEENEEDRKFLDPMALIAMQNQAIKELLARVEALEAKNG